MASTAELFYEFHTHLNSGFSVPENVTVIDPYSDPEVKKVLKQFCNSFYNNRRVRFLILGINPGRHGAGVTGVPFTDPIALETYCNIPNTFRKHHELSSRFIYDMIEAFGGVKKFYNHFILSAVCPLGFLKGTVNYNYYDSADLIKAASPLISESLRAHVGWNASRVTAISLGKKNASFLEAFNKKEKLFENIVTLEHPRYIMQYKLKSKDKYIGRYLEVLNQLI